MASFLEHSVLIGCVDFDIICVNATLIDCCVCQVNILLPIFDIICVNETLIDCCVCQVNILLPIFFLLIMAFLVIFPLFYNAVECLVGLAIIATGLPVYVVLVLMNKPGAYRAFVGECDLSLMWCVDAVDRLDQTLWWMCVMRGSHFLENHGMSGNFVVTGISANCPGIFLFDMEFLWSKVIWICNATINAMTEYKKTVTYLNTVLVSNWICLKELILALKGDGKGSVWWTWSRPV